MDKNRREIVVVDRDKKYLSLVKEKISKNVKGAIVACFTSADDFLRVAEQYRPDLIISAYKLPDMTGLDFLDIINRKKGHNIPVIIITGSGNENVAVEALKRGAKDYLVKSPFVIESISDVVKGILREHDLKKSLMEAERRFQDIVGRLFSWAWETDKDGIYTYSNTYVKEILGYTVKEVLGRPFYDFFPEEERRPLLKVFQNIQKTLSPVFSLEYPLKHKHGPLIYVETNAVPVFDERGVFSGYRGVNRDITWRKEALNNLKESEEQKRAILDASFDWICYVNRDLKIVWANRTILDHVGRPLEEIVNRPCHEIFLHLSEPCEGCPAVKSLETGKTERIKTYKKDLKNMNEEPCWDISSVPLKDEKGDVSGLVVVARDISSFVQAENRIHSLTKQLFDAYEFERRMISSELHDRIAQDLSSLKISIDILAHEIDLVDTDLKKRITPLSDMLKSIISEVRNLSYDLRPPDLEQMGLVRTCYHYCNELAERSGLTMDFNSAGMDDVILDDNIEINLYRLLQEGLNNVVKHADATHVTVKLIASFPNVILWIEDNGKGFNVEERIKKAVEEKHLGLSSMQERVKLLKGEMLIKSAPGKGTKIRIELPCSSH